MMRIDARRLGAVLLVPALLLAGACGRGGGAGAGAGGTQRTLAQEEERLEDRPGERPVEESDIFKPVVIVNRVFFGDPLWIVSLDPTDLRVVGRLDVPGWSDFVFPRGDRLVAVGRSDFGERVAVSLFDVGDPTRPLELTRLEVGGAAQSTSVANSDFRGVRIIEAGVLGATPLVVLPYSDQVVSGGRCVPDHFVQLVDLEPDVLVRRGRLQQAGRVHRAVPIGTKLYSISEKTVAAIDVTQRDSPFAAAAVVVGDLAAPEVCEPVFLEQPAVVTVRSGGCGFAGSGARPGAGTWLALVLVAGAVAWRARRRRCYPSILSVGKCAR